jgi:hypothetical protein
LKEGQLYTSRDLSFKTWEQRYKIQAAVSEVTVDPFKKLNIDPFWEFKVPPSKTQLIARITHYYLISFRQWDGFYPLAKQVAVPKINGN